MPKCGVIAVRVHRNVLQAGPYENINQMALSQSGDRPACLHVIEPSSIFTTSCYWDPGIFWKCMIYNS